MLSAGNSVTSGFKLAKVHKVTHKKIYIYICWSLLYFQDALSILISVISSVADPFHFDADPDPAPRSRPNLFFVLITQKIIHYNINTENINSNEKKILFKSFFMYCSEKNYQILFYFPPTFGWFCIRPKSDPDLFH